METLSLNHLKSQSEDDTVHFVNNIFPPHNVIVEDHDETMHLQYPGEEFDVTFGQKWETGWFCNTISMVMIGTIHVE